MKQMSVVVRTITKLSFAAIFIFGAYIILHGHLTPGGGFQGGAIIGTLMALYMIAYGATKWKKKLLTVFESVGLLGFIGAGFLGLIGGYFFYNVIAGTGFPIFGEPVPGLGDLAHPNWAPLMSAGTISLMNISVGIEVVAGLTLVVVIMGLFAFDGKEDE